MGAAGDRSAALSECPVFVHRRDTFTMTALHDKRSRMPTSKPRKPPAKARRYSRTQPPSDLSTQEWQVALRRQFGREQTFVLRNLGSEPILRRVRNMG